MKFEKKSSIATPRQTIASPSGTHGSLTWGSTLAGQALIVSMALAFNAQAQSNPYQADDPAAPSASPSQPRRTAAATDVFVASAPDTYTVVRGDTLWGIAGRFLKQPWLWPQIWQVNRDQIRNPHWIYPGQTIVLDRINGTMRIGGGPGANRTVKLSPQIRSEPGSDAIPSIPPEAIEPYLTQPLIVESATMLEAPRVVASKERVVLGAGDIAYVSGIVDPAVSNYQLFRPGRPLKDPDTGDVIAYQADYLGTAEITRPGNPATIAITTSKMEVNVGDRLVPATKAGIINYMPHAPAQPVAGRIVATYSGVAYAGANMIVAINRGEAEGLDIGTILAIKSFGRAVTDNTNGVKETIVLPEERKGLLFIFRVFNHIAYGLITTSSDAIQVGDTVSQP